MELRSFVSEALSDIVAGVLEAQGKLPGVVVPPTTTSLQDVASGSTAYQKIDFEIQVTVEASQGTEGKISVMAAFIGAKGAKSKSDQALQSTMLKFSVPIRFPESATHPQVAAAIARRNSGKKKR